MLPFLQEKQQRQQREPEWHSCVRTRPVEQQLQDATPDTLKICHGCSKLYLTAPLVRLVAQARSSIDAVWAQHGPSTCVLLDGGSLFWAANLVSSANLAALAAASLRFPPHIEAVAEKVATRVGPVFNGVHLRWVVLKNRQRHLAWHLHMACAALPARCVVPALALHMNAAFFRAPDCDHSQN